MACICSGGVYSINYVKLEQFTHVNKPFCPPTDMMINSRPRGVGVFEQWDPRTYPSIEVATDKCGQLRLDLFQYKRQSICSLCGTDVAEFQGGCRWDVHVHYVYALTAGKYNLSMQSILIAHSGQRAVVCEYMSRCPPWCC